MKVREANLTSRISQLEVKGHDTSVFSAGMTQTLTLPSNTVVVYDRVFVNVGHDYNSSSGEFVCRWAGYYFFSVHAVAKFGKDVDLVLQLNHKDLVSFNDGGNHATNSVALQLTQGDRVRVVTSGSFSSYFFNKQHLSVATFTGYLIHTL